MSLALLRRHLPRVWTRGVHSYTVESLQALVGEPHPHRNISPSIAEKLGRQLHLQPNHPLNIIKSKIEAYCNAYVAEREKVNNKFAIYDNLPPIATTKDCFDDLLIPADHVSRSFNDTYYVDENTVLRTHTSAHQCTLIRSGQSAFLCSGDVYRKDEIDASHYPVFHQMEGVRIFSESELKNCSSPQDITQFVEDDLKGILSGLARHLFGDVNMRWNTDYFPFTTPSFELEVEYNGKWLEVLGCGVMHREVLRNSNVLDTQAGWAFGLGLERLAMILYDIPDIRLFWSTDPRFTSQFRAGAPFAKFIPYSKYPPCYKDVSFWIPENYHLNEVYGLIRDVAGDMVEKVELFDEFVHPKTGRRSQAFRITFRHMDRSLTNAEVDAIQELIRRDLVDKLHVTLR